jgi:F0F1-type ATP synthase assembly protein I
LLIAILILNLKSLKNINLKKKKYQENKLILITILYAFISTSILVLIGGVGDYVGGRYAALPSFYFLVFFIFIHKLSKKIF